MQLFTNNAKTKLAALASPGAVSFVVTAGQGALFPQPQTPFDFFFVRLGHDATNEVVRCIGRVDDEVFCEALSSAWAADTYVELTTNMQMLGRFPQIIDSDITVTVDPSGSAHFTTIAAALAALERCLIVNNAVVTLAISGKHTLSAPITDAKLLSSPRIKLQGAFDGDKSITSIASSSGSAGAWSVVLNLAAATNIDVGDYLYVQTATGGTNTNALVGCHKVTAVSGSTVTVASKHKTAVPSGAVTATARLFKTVITCNDCNGLDLCNGGFASITDLVFAFNGATSRAGWSIDYGTDERYQRGGKAQIGNGAVAMHTGIVGFSNGVVVGSGATLIVDYGLTVSGCATGIVVDNGAADLQTVSVTGCDKGLHVEMGRVTAPGIKVYGCTDGAVASRAGNIRFSYFAETGDAIIDGCTLGLTASHYGYISATDVTFNANTTNASPAVDTVGNVGGYIDTVA